MFSFLLAYMEAGGEGGLGGSLLAACPVGTTTSFQPPSR